VLSAVERNVQLSDHPHFLHPQQFLTDSPASRIWASVVTPQNPQPNSEPHGQPHQDLDLLISRVVDQDATAAQWSAFESAAAANSVAWRELAMAQRDALALSQAAHAAAARAATFSLPSEADALRPIRLEEARRELERSEASARQSAGRHSDRHSGGRFMSSTRGYLGWAAAAVLAIGFYSGRLNPSVNKPGVGAQTAGLIPGLGRGATEPSATEDHLARYLDQGYEEGRVVGELPEKVLIRATPAAMQDGSIGYDVYYVRQILERAQVSDLYKFGATQDEMGRATVQPVPVRINAPSRGPM